jgi:dihydrofolate reductase
VQEYAKIWQTAEKIVYSKTLSEVSTARTRIERQFDPDAVRALKANVPGVLTVGGPKLAAQAIEAGLVDELQLLLVPVLVGGGKRALPADGARVDLELLDERRFANGSVFVRHRIEAGR